MMSFIAQDSGFTHPLTAPKHSDVFNALHYPGCQAQMSHIFVYITIIF